MMIGAVLNSSLNPFASHGRAGPVDRARTVPMSAGLLQEREAPPAAYPRPIHWSTYITGMGVLSSVILIISGLAGDVLGLVLMGACFLLSSIVGTYYTYSLRYLKTLEEFNDALSDLTEELSVKNREIQTLITQTEALSHTFVDQQKKYTEALQANSKIEERLNEELAQTQVRLQRTTEEFTAAQVQAEFNFREATALYVKAEGNLREQIAVELQQIEQLKESASRTQVEIDQIRQHKEELNQQILQYKQFINEYAIQNERLAREIIDLKRVLSIPGLDSNEVQRHAEQIRQLVAQHVENTNQLERTTVEFNGLMAQIEVLDARVAQLASRIQLVLNNQPLSGAQL